jgi:hypothetical protein
MRQGATAMQQRDKHASTTIELLLETALCNPLLGSCNSWTTTMETTLFSMWFMLRRYLEEKCCDPVSAGSACEGKTRKLVWNGHQPGSYLVVSELRGSSILEAVKTEPEHVKLKNFHCQKLLPENNWWSHSRLEKGLVGAVVICKVWRLAISL